jgi:hypothetical protein
MGVPSERSLLYFLARPSLSATMGSPTPAVLTFVAVVLVILPLPWHYRTKNVATLSIAFWLAQGNIFQAINAIAWMDNVKVKYLVYCNIGQLPAP